MPTPSRSAKYKLAATLVGLAVAWPAGATKPENITSGEMALLPSYCPDTQTFTYTDATGGNPSPRAPYWVGLMGKTFWAMHHYCWALIRWNRLRFGVYPPVIREGMIKQSINDLDYVLRHSEPPFPLDPEIYTRMGEFYLALDAVPQAMEALERARKLKPDYWPPYVMWAEVLLKRGRKQEAQALVEQVLSLKPDDAELRRRYDAMFKAPEQPRPASRERPKDAAPSGR